MYDLVVTSSSRWPHTCKMRDVHGVWLFWATVKHLASPGTPSFQTCKQDSASSNVGNLHAGCLPARCTRSCFEVRLHTAARGSRLSRRRRSKPARDHHADHVRTAPALPDPALEFHAPQPGCAYGGCVGKMHQKMRRARDSSKTTHPPSSHADHMRTR